MCKPEWLILMVDFVWYIILVGKYSNHMDPMGFAFCWPRKVTPFILFFCVKGVGGLKQLFGKAPSRSLTACP